MASKPRSPRPPSARRGVVAAAVLAIVLPASATSAQAAATNQDTLVYSIDPVVVTATRGPRELSRIPQPTSVVQRIELQRQMPNTVTDLFRTLPGLDVTGVGVNQGRPQIRGLKGQRILLLSDGLRLNNSRRQQDFGEIPALIDVTGVERIEVVRGPASVLYGSDAIGGVINVITRTPEVDGIHGMGAFRYGSVEDQYSGTFRLLGRFDAFSVRAGGTLREAQPYFAPAGSFGDITLTDDVVVDGTGAKDQMFDVRLGLDLGGHSVFGKFEQYDAEDSGFGSVNPSAYDPTGTEIRITYPTQVFNKVSAGYRMSDLGAVLADQVEILGYGQDNERQLRFGIGPFQAGPGTLEIDNLNTTDIRTYGMRAEARKLVTPALLLTYGVDAWRDRTVGTDENTTLMVGFGPTPIEDVNQRPQLPEASYLSLGAFLQGEIEASDRISLVAGARYQHVNAKTFDTPGLEDQTPIDLTDGTFVASMNSIVRLTDAVSLVGTVGRGFRSPNLIERFFDGPTPEGGGYQVRNADLGPETSLNVDLGVRFRDGPIGFEAFAFRNKIDDGIRITPLGTQINGQDAFTSTNVDELLYRGIEFGFDANLGAGVTALGSYTWVDTEDVKDVENPVGESFATKQSATLRYDLPGGGFWTAGEVRHNGDQKETNFGSSNPVGGIMPAFTVVNLRSGIRVWRSESGMEHQLNIALTNLTNTLYAEFGNVGFFRPEPKRNLTLSWQVTF
ncbi:MAG: TonB-dependent receptor [Gemmatimonadetes bacterium]|nr:TonB-dependent receptor [Gemmatimonadota bacterium]MDA1102920.1 TonB-dependent receptor [Gemmatimonadota bacterium]